MYLHRLWIGVKWYKLWDHVIEKVLYRRSVFFPEQKPSTIDLQLEKEEKQKEVVQILPTPKQVELCIPAGPNNE